MSKDELHRRVENLNTVIKGLREERDDLEGQVKAQKAELDSLGEEIKELNEEAAQEVPLPDRILLLVEAAQRFEQLEAELDDLQAGRRVGPLAAQTLRTHRESVNELLRAVRELEHG